MEFKHPLIVFLTFFCFLFSTSSAFNITKILANITGYDNFNSLLSQSGLAQKINSRQTITVLAVKDGSLGDLSQKSKDEVQTVLSTHVILDYYDVDKLKNLNKKSSILTTLYQTSGEADHQEGFLNVTKTSNGVMFGSAKKGAPLAAYLVGSVVAQPYNISVLQVSAVIEASGNVNPGAAPPAPTDEAESPAEGPVGSDDAPADAPAADAPTPTADSPAPSTDAASPPAPPADDSPADAPADAPEAKRKSGTYTLRASGFSAVVVMVVASIVGF
ncbi:Fasciclin-like arabinogalactan protein 14 [Euphorbia peplus]|nr:Fasciclin-like arabinogalactan protein 14 [Euphorbia peplus]